jgi:hypothetical protein
MSCFASDEIEELRLLGSLQQAQEGGTTFILISQLALPPGCTPERVDVLLCPTQREGYSSRLFFAQQVQKRSGPAPNWNGSVRILERNWYAFSWRMPTQPMRLAQMVCEHLRGLRCASV